MENPSEHCKHTMFLFAKSMFNHKKGNSISGLKASDNYTIYQAGTARQDGKIVTAGGRVLAITGKGSHLQEALNKAYEGANSVCWDDIYYRKDIGQDLLALS